MKYKVILYNASDATEVDAAGNFSFFVLSQAELCCIDWTAINSTYRAYLWDGERWRAYT